MKPINEPSIEHRAAQPYVGIKRAVTMQTMATIADRIPQLFQWLGEQGIAPTGAPFLRYDVIDMERELIVEAGVPIEQVVEGNKGLADGEVFCDVLPSGRYVTTTHVGAYDELVDVTDQFLRWAATHDLRWDATETDDGTAWGCRLEFYLTNPAEEPDPRKAVTQLAFRLA